MNVRASSIHLFVICGLSVSALVLGYLSLSVKFDVPKRKDHPYKAVQVDGCYQIFDRAYLDRPGCYVLRNDVFVENQIEGFLSIYSDNVDLDLNGKTVSGPGAISTQAGIYVGGGDGIIIRNGTIKDFMFGIRGETGPSGDRLEKIAVKNIEIANASIIGIKLDAVDASLIDVRATSQRDATDSQQQYLFDISVDATNCSYIQTAAHFHRKTLERPSLIRLPADCRKAD
jgi:hypothetical protein